MTYDEVYSQYCSAGIRSPRKGELILSRPNHTPKGEAVCYTVVRVTRSLTRMPCTILVPRDPPLNTL